MSGEPRIQPIQTSFKGYKFRSRLEARWAVFFTALGIKWEYEREGYDIDGRWYLPDFWLPYEPDEEKGWGFWVEIKPGSLDEEQVALLAGIRGLGSMGFRSSTITTTVSLRVYRDSREAFSARRTRTSLPILWTIDLNMTFVN
jgi:hypothetical protein